MALLWRSSFAANARLSGSLSCRDITYRTLSSDTCMMAFLPSHSLLSVSPNSSAGWLRGRPRMTDGSCHSGERTPQQDTTLIVDGDVIARTVIADYLRHCGYRVIEAHD